MNAVVTKVLSYGISLDLRPLVFSWSVSRVRVFVLLCAIFITSLSVVYVKDLNRRLFINVQNVEQINSELNTNYGKLLLEESTLRSQSRIQRVASNNLQMKLPAAQEILIIKLA